ncbi:MAG TPA: thymidine phosphorylase, partial [Balneola sp.]|nr:thymidine phosphorylase [Balneola sp.]
MNSKYNIVSLIRKKRDGKVLSQDEIRFLIDSYTADEIPDYQISSFLMAAFLNGLNDEESAALTESMLHSGIVVDLSHVPGKKVDKHSTGGVGDKLSLILAPIVASAGVPVPMISGRGLGHTGGTLDKLESIPGFYVDVDLARYKEILEKQNLVLVGQTEEIAPADKRLYALRDVTATVESIPLIAGSIMSKKLAEGIDALVLDVKYGSGAFMKTEEDATKLAQALVGIGEQFEKETIAYLTNMKQPLGYKIGNWFEVEESVDALKGVGPDDIMELSHLLSGTMIYLGGKADSVEKGIEVSKQQVENGEAYQKWLDIVEEQGGDTSFIENTAKYPIAKFEFELKSSRDGYVTAMDAFEIGTASVELGAGRK